MSSLNRCAYSSTRAARRVSCSSPSWSFVSRRTSVHFEPSRSLIVFSRVSSSGADLAFEAGTSHLYALPKTPTTSSSEDSSLTDLKKVAADLAWIPSFVFSRLPNHQRPWEIQCERRSEEWIARTYNESGKSTTEDHTVDCQHPDPVLSLHNPFRKSDTHGCTLRPIGVVVFDPILFDFFVGQPIEVIHASNIAPVPRRKLPTTYKLS